MWKQFDPTGSKFIKEEDLPKFLTTLKPPLGFGNVSDDKIKEVNDKLDIPTTHNGCVYFPDVLISLTEHLYDIVIII